MRIVCKLWGGYGIYDPAYGDMVFCRERRGLNGAIKNQWGKCSCFSPLIFRHVTLQKIAVMVLTYENR